MDVNEFAEYVINNMCRATIGNALNIAKSFNDPEHPTYKFEEFINSVEKYLNSLLAGGYNKQVCYKVFVLADNTMKKYNSNIKYNKSFIIDDFIIELWRIMNGH